jgi:hypothetical protein
VFPGKLFPDVAAAGVVARLMLKPLVYSFVYGYDRKPQGYCFISLILAFFTKVYPEKRAKTVLVSALFLSACLFQQAMQTTTNRLQVPNL